MVLVFIYILAQRALRVAQYFFDSDPPPATHTAKGGCSASCLLCAAPLQASVSLLHSSLNKALLPVWKHKEPSAWLRECCCAVSPRQLAAQQQAAAASEPPQEHRSLARRATTTCTAAVSNAKDNLKRLIYPDDQEAPCAGLPHSFLGSTVQEVMLTLLCSVSVLQRRLLCTDPAPIKLAILCTKLCLACAPAGAPADSTQDGRACHCSMKPCLASTLEQGICPTCSRVFLDHNSAQA